MEVGIPRLLSLPANDDWNWLILVLEVLLLPAPEVSRSFEISRGRSIYTRQWAKSTEQDTLCLLCSSVLIPSSHSSRPNARSQSANERG